VSGFAFRYYSSVAIQTPVPEGLGGLDHAAIPGRHADLLDRGVPDARVGRRVPVHRGRPAVPGRRRESASWIAGLRINVYRVLVYVVAAVFYGIAQDRWPRTSAR
jgi:hypothetical protein